MRRVTALLLALSLAISLMTTPALAAEEVPSDPSIGMTETEEESATASEEEAEQNAEMEEPVPEEDVSTPDSSEASAEEPEPEAPAEDESSFVETGEGCAELDVTEESGVFMEATAYYTVDTVQRIITVKCSNGSNIRTALNQSLLKAKSIATASKIYTVKVPKGSYTVSAALRIYSNTTLDLTNVTLTYSGSSGNLLTTGNQTDNKNGKGGYADYANVTIKNGTIKGNSKCGNCLVRMAHGTNITLSGVTFDKCYGDHQVEVAGINGFTVKNCTFKNIYPPSSASSGYEALELDILANSKCFGDFIEDGTMMKNVTITGCSFTNCPRGVGCHNQLLGAYHQNITISDNTFSNLKDAAIFATAFRNCTIENNTITNCGRGIYFVMVRAAGSSVYTHVNGKGYVGSIVQKSDSKISNNSIKVKVIDSKWCSAPVGIHLYGHKYTKATKGNAETVPAGDYALSNVTVQKNTISSSGNGIRLERTKNSTISSNTVTYTGASGKTYYGIQTGDSSTGNTITGNTISKFPRYNIRIYGSSSAKSVSSNTLSGSGSYGIYVASASASSITANKITSSSSYGLYLSSITAKCSVLENKISGCASYPIRVNASTSYTVTLNENTITTKSGSYGIYVSKGAISICDNIISGGKYAVYTSKGVKGSIYYNNLKTSGLTYAIQGSKSYKVGNTGTVSLSTVSKKASGSMTVKWKKVSGASGYVIQYSTKSDMSDSTKVTVTSGSTLSKTISGLAAGKTYYVRVRAYRTCNSVKVYSKYSSKKTITV